MKSSINNELAVKIAQKIMEVVPYNINVMNNEGVIIASGDIERVGNLHRGALKVIQKNDIHEIKEDTMTERMGVNLPLRFHEEVVGVIGISGDLEMVRPLGYVIKVTAELMIDQQYTLNADLRKKIEFNNFLSEWSNTPKKLLGEKFFNDAQIHGINIDLNRICAVIQPISPTTISKDFASFHLKPDEYILRMDNNNLLLIFNSSSYDASAGKLISRLKNMVANFEGVCHVGLGIENSDMNKSAIAAKKALSYAEKMNDLRLDRSSLVRFDNYINHDVVLHYDDKYAYENLIKTLEQKDASNELLQTFIAYFQNDGNMNDIITQLHIHRNTLTYRLRRIEELTKMNFKNYNNKFFMYYAYLYYHLR